MPLIAIHSLYLVSASCYADVRTDVLLSYSYVLRNQSCLSSHLMDGVALSICHVLDGHYVPLSV